MTTMYCARWVLPIASGMIEDGAVAVEDARIAGVDTRLELTKRFPHFKLQDYGEAAILPGLVNAHSHLELTLMRGFLEREETNFFEWLRKLTVTRMERMTADDLYVSAAWGAIEAARAGVTSLGDASDAAQASMKAVRDVGLRANVYKEVFGPDEKLAREQLVKLQERVSILREMETPLVRVGVSPHAPYTVSRKLIELVTQYALAENLPVMMHAAESVHEAALMRDGTGLFAESLKRRGIEWRVPGVSTIQYLAREGALQTKPLLAHCITVDDADIELLRESGARVAHCPKSNLKLFHGRAPLAGFLEKKLTVGFGSDSVATNNTCDMLEEARFALLLTRMDKTSEASPEQTVTAEDALQIVTQGGARALGWDERTGALSLGLDADLTIIQLDGAHQLPVHDVAAALVFASSGRDVRLTVVAGREVYRDGQMLTVDEERLRARVKEIAVKMRGS
ncbi:MAG: amidohydrolase family protein [Pyrinomonadaceae bacterium]